MATETEQDRLTTQDGEYMARSIDSPDVYAGSVLFIAGVGFGIASVVTSMYTSAFLGNGAYLDVLAIGLASIGLPLIGTSIVVFLPSNRQLHYVAGLGVAVCAVGTILFGANTVQSLHAVGVYSVGISAIVVAIGIALFELHLTIARATGESGPYQGVARMASNRFEERDDLLSQLIWVETPDRVLIVDDDREFRSLLKHSLEAAGFIVETTGDANACLERLDSDDPQLDAVLLDLSMPGIDGFETLRHINELPQRLPVIVITGRSGEHEQIRAFELGAVDFIQKPVNIKVLTARVERHLDRWAP